MSEGDSGVLKIFSAVFVFCRVRPIDMADSNSNIIIKTPTTVSLINSAENQKKETLCVFKRVFGPESTQSEVYRTVAQPLVEKLLFGRNGLLFTYGVTGSGKTHTMMGSSDDLGLMPRCLDTLFRTISGCHARKSIFQPDHLNGFEIITETEAIAKQKAERRANSSQKTTSRSKSTEIVFNLDSLQDTMHVPGIDERNVYAIFISYIEIYNNNVYDLLEENCGQKIQSRIVREDANHNMYVHGVTEIEIRSVSDGMEAFYLGQKRKRIGHTVLNAESSRSHAVFNIRLVQAPIGEHDREDKRTITVSQLSLVDLAGSERSSRTKNTGARLREAGNINNSLMTLRTCLEYLRENQQATFGTALKKIPYRDSKITQLFKNFFEGEGQVCMITCVNPRVEDYIENTHVMRFAELTQEVQVPCAATVQLTNSDNDVIKLLRTKFGGNIEGSVGDGPLSEKLCNLFQQQMKKYEKSEKVMQTRVEKYCLKVCELEQRNRSLLVELSELRLFNRKTLEQNRLLEDTVKSQRTLIEELQEKLNKNTNFKIHKNGFKTEDHIKKEIAKEWSLKNAISSPTLNIVSHAQLTDSQIACILKTGNQRKSETPKTLVSAIMFQRTQNASKAFQASAIARSSSAVNVSKQTNFLSCLTNINTLSSNNSQPTSYSLSTSFSCSSVPRQPLLEFD